MSGDGRPPMVYGWRTAEQLEAGEGLRRGDMRLDWDGGLSVWTGAEWVRVTPSLAEQEAALARTMQGRMEALRVAARQVWDDLLDGAERGLKWLWLR